MIFGGRGPNVFQIPTGVDFARALVCGLRDRFEGEPPEALARVTLYLNTARMRRRVVEAFIERGPGLLPRIRLLTDVAEGIPLLGLPMPISPLRRRLELTQLIAGLLERQPDLAPRSALYDLADSLAELMDEMQGEGVTPARIAELDVSEHSAHWGRTREFLKIVNRFFSDSDAPDTETRQRLAVNRLAALWEMSPPTDPVIVAGSTGSRGTTAALMCAVARLPQGAIILPGFDPHLPEGVWQTLDDAMTGEDHPQFRMRRLMDKLSVELSDIRPWTNDRPPAEDRNRLISLSLRPAPVTDQWLHEGKTLPDLVKATEGMTLIEAATPRIEAVCIALALREAAEAGRSAALITPDRMLTRRVTAALDRWGIIPDDSAGKPLALSAPGRFLRHIAGIMGSRLTSDVLLALLKHPISFTGGDRGKHLLNTRDLELQLRRKGPAFPTGEDLRHWAKSRTREDSEAAEWAEALARIVDAAAVVSEDTLAKLVASHLDLAEMLARGTASEGTGIIWERAAGEAAQTLMQTLRREADAGGTITPAAYRDLFDAVIAKGEVRESVLTHPDILILGPREARENGAELVVLAGLNDGSWPRLPEPDPWLNRRMRKDAGLLLPERQVGLSAHDYQIAVAAPRVILTRAARDADAETVASRWLNRLTNLMEGLPDRGGKTALAEMRQKGEAWIRLAEALERPTEVQSNDPRLQPARRPSPRPPAEQRPKELSLTRISLLIRDPYAIYCRYVLRLRRLDPLRHEPDAALRGQILHKILERFVRERPLNEARTTAKVRLIDTAREVLGDMVPWPAARTLWLARVARAADFFLSVEGRDGGTPIVLERAGGVQVEPFDFRLTGTPDRIDRLPDGRLHILDYKTGSPPTEAMQKAFDKQLLLAAAMAERGGFPGVEGGEVARITYVGLGSNPKTEETEITEGVTEEVWDGLKSLVAHYAQESTGYTARRAVMKERFETDYDHLSRFGEWDTTDRPVSERLEARK